MKTSNLITCLFVCLIAIPAFSQEPVKKVDTTAKEEGLRKIASGSGLKNLNIEVDIDEVALENSIQLAIKNAMESMRVLETLEIHIEPIEINLKKLDLNLDVIRIEIPRLDINLEPIDIDLNDMDFDIDIDMDNDRDWDDNDENDHSLDWDKEKEKNKEKDKVKEKDKGDKLTKEEKDKSKGLKKLN